MSYAGIQTKVLALLQELSDFDANNSAESDFRLLAHGKAAYAVLLKGPSGRPGKSGQLDVANGQKSYGRRDDYTVEMLIFARFTTDQLDTRASVTALTDAVEAHFDDYPDLDSYTGIIDARIDVVGTPEEWTVGAGNYWMQQINLEVVELSTVYMAEYHGGTIFRWDGATAWDGTGVWI